MNLRSAANAAVLLAALAACKPSAHGRCVTQADCRAGAYCGSGGICLSEPSTPPSVIVSVPAASDSFNGWVPRTAGNLEIRALVDDGGGIGPTDATLSLNTCPGGGLACSYVGSIVARSGSAATFSFQVPRAVQAAGSEAPVPVTVTATNPAGKQGTGPGMLLIDDAPPQIGATAPVTAGAKGEDGRTWFLGGLGAPPVEIAAPATDLGSGVASLALMLDSADVASGTPLDVSGTSMADGWHFKLPVSAVQGREAKLRFTLTATDNLQHVSTLGPDHPTTFILVDALPPTVTTPVVQYLSDSVGGVCAASSSTFTCGRQGATHLLRDDAATVTFDVYDCGVGIAAPQVTITSATVPHAATVTQTGTSGMPCANGSRNPAHHFSFPLDVSALSALDPPDATGTSPVALAAKDSDLLANAGAAPAASAQVSLWRWKEQLTGNITGSPALLASTAPGAARAVVVGTDASSGANVFALGADGTQNWSATAAAPIGGDVAVGSDGATVYAVAPTAGLLSIASQGATVQKCGLTGATFGAPPAIVSISSKDAAIVVATATANITDPNLFAFQLDTTSSTTCKQLSSKTSSAKPTGASAGVGSIFVSHSAAFSSFDTSFNNEVDYNGVSGGPAALAAPSVYGTMFAGAKAIFGTAATADKKIYNATSQGSATPCTVTKCWQAISGFPTAAANSGLPFTPDFDGTNIFTADDAGTVYAWSFTSGNAVTGFPVTLTGGTVSSPVLLVGGGMLVVHQDGNLKIVTPAGKVVVLGSVGAFTSTPLAPALDIRDLSSAPGGVAYVPAPSKWIYAWQIPAEPVPGSATAWPRPGHDSCNSRNSGTSASACP